MVRFCREKGSLLTVTLQVQPRARKTEIVGVHGEALKMKVAAPPVDGAANDELVRFFAELLGVARSSVEVRHGATGRKKVIEIDGVSTAEFTALLLRQGLLTIKLG